jgi:apolipoprotein N-acyltransferase
VHCEPAWPDSGLLSYLDGMQQRAARPQPVAIAESAQTLLGKPTVAPMWRSPTLWLALAGALLLWLSFPPLDWWPLAWIAPLPWLWLIRQPELAGRRPYAAIWLAGFVYWLFMLYGISRAHEALIAGWIALSWYLAFYVPFFVWLARVAVHRLGISLIVAAPVVWVGLELIRGHLITGFSAGLLGHTQVAWPMLLQISDLVGAYGVSFLMMLIAASLARMLPQSKERWTLWPAAIAALALVMTLAYGTFRLSESPPKANREPLRVALIQGSLDTQFDQNRIDETFAHYDRLTSEARAANSRLDLVIWPESMFAAPEQFVEQPLTEAPGDRLPPDRLVKEVAAYGTRFDAILAAEAARANIVATDGTRQATPTYLLLGTNTYVYGPHEERRSYNAALLADHEGHVTGRYYKTHPVMFGEYIPFAQWLPWLYKITPMNGGLSIGDGPKTFEVDGLALSPSICFESVVPHLIRRQVIELDRRGTPADVLVNVTNDGWFWGTAILDLHFRCAIFRAIENRKPVIIAANTGFSGWIDGNGRVLAQGPRRAPQVLIAEVVPDGRASPYHLIGDWPAILCALVCLVLAAIGWRKAPANESSPGKQARK